MKSVKIAKHAVILAAMLALSGCATIMNGSTQDVNVVTTRAGRPVYGAQCELRNSRGTWLVMSGQPVTISRAYSDMEVQCIADKTSGSGKMVSVTNGGAIAANLMLDLCIFSCPIDMSSGALWAYPPRITIDLQ